MHVYLGPYPSEIVSAWSGYAQKMLDEVTSGDAPPVQIDPGVRQTLESFLIEWEDIAGREDILDWSADIPVDLLWFLVEAWLPVANHLAAAAEGRGYALMPPECEPFYRGLVETILGALENESGYDARQAEDLRDRWPG